MYLYNMFQSSNGYSLDTNEYNYIWVLTVGYDKRVHDAV